MIWFIIFGVNINFKVVFFEISNTYMHIFMKIVYQSVCIYFTLINIASRLMNG